MAEPLRTLVDSVLSVVARDAPFCTEALGRAMGRMRVGVHVADESFVVRWSEVGGAASTTTSRPLSADVKVESTPTVLLDLVDGRVDLVTAILSNALRVQASAAQGSALFDALAAFVEGGARSPDTAPLLDAYRTQIHRYPETSTP